MKCNHNKEYAGKWFDLYDRILRRDSSFNFFFFLRYDITDFLVDRNGILVGVTGSWDMISGAS